MVSYESTSGPFWPIIIGVLAWLLGSTTTDSGLTSYRSDPTESRLDSWPGSMDNALVCWLVATHCGSEFHFHTYSGTVPVYLQSFT